MIHLIEAKPGQGKSVYATYLILNTLVFRKKVKIATNIDLKIPEKYHHRVKYVNDWFDIKVLIDEHLQTVLTTRNREGTLLIVLDELSLLLNARAWDSLPTFVMYVLRQHRKYGVDIIGFSQSVKDIDVAYRRLVQRLFTIRKLFILPVFKWTWGFFMIREWDSDDVDKDKNERRPLGIISAPPVFALVDPWVFDSMDSWALLELRHKPEKIVHHVTEKCEDPACAYHKVAHHS